MHCMCCDPVHKYSNLTYMSTRLVPQQVEQLVQLQVKFWICTIVHFSSWKQEYSTGKQEYSTGLLQNIRELSGPFWTDGLVVLLDRWTWGTIVQVTASIGDVFKGKGCWSSAAVKITVVCLDLETQLHPVGQCPPERLSWVMRLPHFILHPFLCSLATTNQLRVEGCTSCIRSNNAFGMTGIGQKALLAPFLTSQASCPVQRSSIKKS